MLGVKLIPLNILMKVGNYWLTFQPQPPKLTSNISHSKLKGEIN